MLRHCRDGSGEVSMHAVLGNLWLILSWFYPIGEVSMHAVLENLWLILSWFYPIGKSFISVDAMIIQVNIQDQWEFLTTETSTMHLIIKIL